MPDEVINQVFLKSNVIGKEETKSQIKEILNKIAETVSYSLGPYGSTTIIQDSIGNHKMSKDGYTILKNIHYYHDIPKTVLEIVRKISKSLVRTVGDGSTSAIIIANEMYSVVEKIGNSQYALAPKDLIYILNILSEIFERKIKENATKITDENFDESITKIAAVSNNNDLEAGKLIKEVFSKIGRYGFISLETNNSLSDKYEINQGFEVNRGWINSRMVNQNDKVTADYKDVCVFMCNDILDDSDMSLVATIIEKVCLKLHKPLVIVASNYSSSFKAFFDSNLQRNKNLELVAIDMDCSTNKGKNNFEDLALALDCQYYDKYGGDDNFKEDIDINRLGLAERFICDDIRSKFLEGYGCNNNSELIQEHIKKLEEKYNQLLKEDYSVDREDELFLTKKRIATLNNSMATIYVGGNTETERETRKYLMEDAVYACRSSLEYGYVVGGNLIIPKIIKREKDNIIEELINEPKLNYLKASYNTEVLYHYILSNIFDAFSKSFQIVLRNSYYKEVEINKILERCWEDEIYNLNLRRFENDDDTNIINSAQTEIEIIKACFSIIGLLATSNQFLMVNAISLKDTRYD